MKAKYYAICENDKQQEQEILRFEDEQDLLLFFVKNLKNYTFKHLVKGVELDYDIKLKEKKFSEIREQEEPKEKVIAFPQ